MLKEQQGDLTELYTGNKESLVGAINEIKEMETTLASLLDEINGEVI